jgi:4-amino-4-deoxy-L-arabinose transferase-like glycosyltransferase
MLPRLTLPPPPAALAVMAAAFILPGLVFHDLWKTQDAIALGIVHGMAVSGDLVVPRVAGVTWLADQPLYHWVALLFGKLTGWAIEFHAGARLASGLFVAAAFAFIYRAERDWTLDDPDTRRTAAGAAFLVLMGCGGLLVHSHEALPELASLAAMCAAMFALTYAAQKPVYAGIAFGVALGVAFLAASWMAPVGLAAAVLVAHFVVPGWRTKGGVTFLVIAFVIALVMATAWPLALALRSGGLLLDWWDLVSQRSGSPGANLRHFFSTASWFTWPAWPLALWSAWSLRRRWRELRLFVPAVAVIAIGALYALWGPPQDENLIPLLAPLSLLAAHGVFTLRRGAVAALDWFGVLTFAVFTGLVWLGYIAMLTGWPAPMARNFARIAPGFVTQFHPLAVLVALVLMVLWLYLIFFTPFSPMRSVARWAGGMVLLWGTVAMLWMPWVDYQKSYRSVALQLKSRLPVEVPCLASRALGVSQAAALDYHGGIRTQPFDTVRPTRCPLVLVQGTPQSELDAPPSTGKVRWTKLADVGRPGDRAERYRLYRLER